MTKDKGIYLIGEGCKYNNKKYNDLKYDKELYIPKGFIIPSGEMITDEYELEHDDMAKRFIEENYYIKYKNDYIKDYKDYLIMRLNALQVLVYEQKKILYCDLNMDYTMNKAIASYLENDWREIVLPNPRGSFYDYIYQNMYDDSYNDDIKKLIKK